jgi:flagellar basal-body rod modification protein FlgD
MAVDPLTAANGTLGSLGGTQKKDQMGQAQFMTLMIAQLKNQDPTKPMDPSEFLGQLAQFGTVSGIQDMQKSLTTLSDSLRSSQVLGGTNLVGREVLADADTAALGDTGSITGATAIPEGATAAGIIVTDSSGQLIRRLPISAQQGEVGFRWDGMTDLGTRAPAGSYKISAIANVGGEAQQQTTQLVGRVGSVTIDAANNNLTLNTDLGPFLLSRVRRVM